MSGLRRVRWLLGSLAVSTGVFLGPDPAQAAQRVATLDGNANATARPWADKVSLQQQEAATVPFEEGNSLLQDSLFKAAAEKYIAALKIWNHPGIHFNLALALVSLEKPVEAHAHFVEAIRYGSAPIDEDKLERAKSYISLLEQQLATVQIKCDEPGAIVQLDGNVLFTAPGKAEVRVKIGEHTFSATKMGYERTDVTHLLKPKETLPIQLRVYRPDQLVVYKKKFADWIPVLPLVGGALGVGGGVALGFLAQDSYRKFDAAVNGDPLCRPGEPVCPTFHDGDGLKAQGDMFQTVSIVSYGVGGALAATGLVLLIVNRPVAERVTPAQLNEKVSFLPWAGPAGAGLIASGSF